MVNRRRFLKTGCLACLGLASSSYLLSSCAAGIPMQVVKRKPEEKVLRVAKTSFEGEQDMVIVRDESLENDILLRKTENGYLALDLTCTHEGVGLTTTKSKIYCTSHGSVFDLEGNVVKTPANKPLKRYQTEAKETEILIYLT